MAVKLWKRHKKESFVATFAQKAKKMGGNERLKEEFLFFGKRGKILLNCERSSQLGKGKRIYEKRVS